MASTSTLLSLRTRARQRADMEGSLFVSDAELNQLINTSVAELYDLLVSVNSEYYLSSQTLTLIPGTDTYSLPVDFYKLQGVDGIIDSQGNAYTLRPFNFAERNNALYTTAASGPIVSLRYRLLGQNMRFIPVPSAAGSIKLWYISIPTPLALDTDTFDGINGWEEYVIVDAAMKMLIKEESDVSALMSEKQGLTARINTMASSRDSGTPDRVVDVTRVNPWDLLNHWGQE